ncbi:MAG: AbrB/MazE/SpoVT family DNA-binding domain-containing protein [Armatimonadetes bacterium]|nr:AbrB/MazE/SpoVT family DNA-binding domain-containing protein [Armatimonadota bacterium]
MAGAGDGPNGTAPVLAPPVRGAGREASPLLDYSSKKPYQFFLDFSARTVIINLEILKLLRFTERKIQAMALLKLRRFSQVTLPADLRKKLHLSEGDYLEAEVVDQGILLKPVTVMEREKAWKQIFEAVGSVQDKKPRRKQNPKQQEEEIAEMVKAFRKRRA